MKIFQFTRQARQDLLAIVDELGDDNPACSLLVTAIEARCRLIAEFPESGPTRGDLVPGLRSVVVHPYLISYQKPAEFVQVVRILHGRRDLRTIFRSKFG